MQTELLETLQRAMVKREDLTTDGATDGICGGVLLQDDDADVHETSSSSAWRVRVASANAYSGGLSSLEKRYL